MSVEIAIHSAHSAHLYGIDYLLNSRARFSASMFFLRFFFCCSLPLLISIFLSNAQSGRQSKRATYATESIRIKHLSARVNAFQVQHKCDFLNEHAKSNVQWLSVCDDDDTHRTRIHSDLKLFDFSQIHVVRRAQRKDNNCR